MRSRRTSRASRPRSTPSTDPSAAAAVPLSPTALGGGRLRFPESGSVKPPMSSRRPSKQASGRARTSDRSKQPTLVLLVRHGATPTTGAVLPGRAQGLHLSERGRDQAGAAAGRIAALSAAALYSSPLERTRETAAPIARSLGLRVRSAKGLTECDFGEWTGERLSRLRKLAAWSTVQDSPSTFRFPGGESFTEMQARMTTTIAELTARHPGETIVAVSHADPIKAVLAQCLGVHLDMFQRIVVSPCSISAVLVGDGAPTVLAVNSTGDDLNALVPS